MSKSNNAICTIVTESYLPWAYSLAESVGRHQSNLDIFILISDLTSKSALVIPQIDNVNVYVLTLNELAEEKNYNLLLNKYGGKSSVLRWSLKPLLMQYLIAIRKVDKVIWVDADIRFYSNFQFLLDELNSSDFLITPHWFNPHRNQNIEKLRQSGIYNAGFIAVNKHSVPILQWWLKRCLYRCDFEKYYYLADQGYLDLIPTYFKNAKAIDHKGCNIAYWNADYLKRVHENDAYTIEFEGNSFPLVFYHFAGGRYQHFVREEEQFIGVLEELNSSLQKFGFTEDLIRLAKSNPSKKKVSMFNRIKNSLYSTLPYKLSKTR